MQHAQEEACCGAVPLLERIRHCYAERVTVLPKDAARTLRERDAVKRKAGEAHAARLRARLSDARDLLVTRYGVRTVILFGSLATGSATEDSDVDLAVHGLERGVYFDALSDLMGIFGGPVDLVRMEDARESLIDRIAAEGETL